MSLTTSDSGRAILDPKAQEAVTQMLARLRAKEACIRISSSKLVCWIIERYFDTAFEDDQERIIQRHFDSKEYLKNEMKAAQSPEDVERILKSVLVRVTGNVDPPKRLKRNRRDHLDAAPADGSTQDHDNAP